MPDFSGKELTAHRARPLAAPLRLAFVSHALRPEDHGPARVGGLERAAAELLDVLRRREDIVVTPIVDAVMSDPLRFAAFSASALSRLGRMARAGEIDAVLFSAMPTGWMSVPLEQTLRRAGVASAAICHGHDVIMPFGPYQHLVRRAFRSLDAVMPVSRATGARCVERGLAPDRLHVTPNGADVERFAPAPPPEARRGILKAAFPREAAGVGSDELVIASVGRQAPRKGHAWFVREVMPRLPAGAHFWLAGEGPEAKAIEAAAGGDAGARVRRLGGLSEARLAALYRGADLFVMPNLALPGDIEGFGLVLLEAALNGLPVVCADLEGMADVVLDGVNGRLAASGDAAAFAAAVRELSGDPDLRERFARAAEVRARGRFSWSAIAERHVDILRRYQSCHSNLASPRPLPMSVGGCDASRDQGGSRPGRLGDAPRLRPAPSVREQRPGGVVGPQAG